MMKLHARGLERSLNWSLPQVIAWIVTRDLTRVEALGEESRRARNEPPVGLNEAESSLMFAYFDPMLATRTETEITGLEDAVKRFAAELTWQQKAVYSCRDARRELLTRLQRGELRVRAIEESQVEPPRFDRAEFADIVDYFGNPHPVVVHISRPDEPLLTDPLFASEDVVRLWPPPPVSIRAANEAVERMRRHLEERIDPEAPPSQAQAREECEKLPGFRPADFKKAWTQVPKHLRRRRGQRGLRRHIHK